jgi:DNA-binding transcriptional ArsR family regulator
VSFGQRAFNSRPARPEDIRGVLRALEDGEYHTPIDIATLGRLTQTAVLVALSKMEAEGQVEVRRQGPSPKVLVRLAGGPRR